MRTLAVPKERRRENMSAKRGGERGREERKGGNGEKEHEWREGE